MAVAYLDRQPISRGKGQSILAKAAYNSCSFLEASDGIKDYSKKSGLAYASIITSDESPAPARATFWKAIEAKEKRIDAQLGYTYEIAIPKELNKEQRIALATDYAKSIINRYGFEAVDLCIHEPTKRRKDADKAKENPHIHLLTPTRTRDGKKIRLFNNKEDLHEIRKLWEETANRHLEQAGFAERISLERVEKQLETLDHEIKSFEEKQAEIEKQLASINQALEEYHERGNIQNSNKLDQRSQPSKRFDHNGKGRENNIRRENREENTKNDPKSTGNGSGHQERVRDHKRSLKPDRRSTRQGTIASPSPNTRGYRQPLRETRTHRAIFTKAAKKLASKIDGLRFNRQAQYQSSTLTSIAKLLASRIDGVRYERSTKFRTEKNIIYRPTF